MGKEKIKKRMGKELGKKKDRENGVKVKKEKRQVYIGRSKVAMVSCKAGREGKE